MVGNGFEKGDTIYVSFSEGKRAIHHRVTEVTENACGEGSSRCALAAGRPKVAAQRQDLVGMAVHNVSASDGGGQVRGGAHSCFRG